MPAFICVSRESGLERIVSTPEISIVTAIFDHAVGTQQCYALTTDVFKYMKTAVSS